MRKLNLNDVEDPIIKQNFQNIERDFNGNVFKDDNFRFFKADVINGTTRFSHNLGFQPKDVILLSYSPDTATISFKFDSFTRDEILIVSNQAVSIRFFLGSYKESENAAKNS